LGTGRAGNGAVTEDTFTPSSQNSSAQATEQDAGIFQVSKGALAAITAHILFAPTTPNANQNGAPAQAAATNSTTSGNAAQQVAAALAAQAATAAAAATTNVQDQLQALNAALPVLGLSTSDILQIDRVATLDHNFSPTTYTDLVNQFEALAQLATQQSTASAAANATSAASPNPTANTNAGTNANGGRF
jgi:hypothetical protein